MKTIGFPISEKENEQRRAILPCDLVHFGIACNNIYIEKNYGVHLGVKDEEFQKIGCKVCEKKDVLNCDIIVDPKIGDAKYLNELKENTIIFGWIHATQNKDIADIIVDKKIKAFAWEKMYEDGRHIFWRNNELAGEAAVLHAFQCYGKMPYGMNVAVIGNGNTARGAIKVLNMFGANVIQYTRKTEKLIAKEIENYDVVVNAVLWDVFRKDHIIGYNELKRMKKNALIIDVSCDKCGAIESSIPTTIEQPTYFVNDVMHYVVDHTPSIFYRTFTEENSKIIAKYIKDLMEENIDDVLQNSLIIDNGKIIDKEIIEYQNR